MAAKNAMTCKTEKSTMLGLPVDRWIIAHVEVAG